MTKLYSCPSCHKILARQTENKPPRLDKIGKAKFQIRPKFPPEIICSCGKIIPIVKGNL